MSIDISFLETELVGSTVPVPLSGTLSGHAAGEPFDKHTYALIKKRYTGTTFRQYEYLNKLYLDNPEAVSTIQRWGLIKSPALSFLLKRGKDTTMSWSPSSLFEEKQNDTADIVVIKEGFFNLIDVKTYNISKKGQPPNIISAFKVAKMCALMLDSRDFDSHDISYVGITWDLNGKLLECTRACVKELFRTDPASLYINWAAAMQIQFHVENLDQSYSGSIEQWCKEYLCMFVGHAGARARRMQQEFVDPFKRFLE